MLRITEIEGHTFSADDCGESLFYRNPELTFTVEAPMYWWIECEQPHFSFTLPKKNFKFCLDRWRDTFPYIQEMKLVLGNTSLEDRQLMQILPLGTLLEAKLVLSYRQLVEICENYQYGEYEYKGLYNQWPTEREWSDFCETLMDIRGVRTLLERRNANVT